MLLTTTFETSPEEIAIQLLDQAADLVPQAIVAVGKQMLPKSTPPAFDQIVAKDTKPHFTPVERLKMLFKRNKVICDGTFIQVHVCVLNANMNRRTILVDSNEKIGVALQLSHTHPGTTHWISWNDKPLNLEKTFADYGMSTNSCLQFNPRLRGGSRKQHVASMLLVLASMLSSILIWMSLLLSKPQECEYARISATKRLHRKQASGWLRVLASQTTPPRKSLKHATYRYCPQHEAIRMLEQDVLNPSSPTLTNAQWEYAYERAIEKHTLAKFEAQSLGFTGMEQLLETSLSVCDKSGVDDYVKLAEDVLVMLMMLSKSKTHVDMVGSIAVFAKLRVKSSLTLGAFREALKLALDWFFKPNDLQSYELEDIRKIMDNYAEMKHSPLAERLHCFMLFALGYSLFDSIGMKVEPLKLKSMTDAAKDKTAWKSADFTYLCLETILFICERGSQCYKMGSIQPMFHSTKTHAAWVNDVEKLKIWATCLGNPSPHGFTVFQYQNELDTLIEKGDSIVKVMAAEGPREKMAASRLLCDLKMLKASFITSNDASRDRIEPFGTLVAGGSSVMKSTFSKILFYHYAKVMGLPGITDYRYVRNCLDEYWSGFKTSKWCIHLDDIAPFKPSAVPGVDPSVAEALQVLNTVAYVTNQAELNDKGKIPIRARLVTATTNVIDMNAFAYYENDLAPRRRFPVVLKLDMKPEFTKNGMCDPSTIPTMSSDYLNVWMISMYKVVAAEVKEDGEIVPKQRAKLELVQKYDDIDDFLEAFSAMAKRQYEVQQKAEKDDKVMATVEICNSCYRRRCNCFAAQASEHEEDRIDDNVSESSYASSVEILDDAELYHTCEYDREVVLNGRTATGWNVKLAKPTGLQLLSGSYKFHAVQRDLLRGPNFSLVWCGAHNARIHEEASFNEERMVVDVLALNDVTTDYFDVIREKKTPLQLTWWTSFASQYTLNFMINNKCGRWLATKLFVCKLTRGMVFQLLYAMAPKKFSALARLAALKVDVMYKRHPYLIKIAALCSVSLVTYLTLQKLRPAKKAHVARMDVGPRDDDDDDRTLFQKYMRVEKPSSFKPQVSAREPKPHTEEYENVWSDHDAKQVRFSVSDMSASWAGLSWDNIHAKVKWNTAHATLRKKGFITNRVVHTRMLCISSRVYLINRHAWIEGSEITMLYESNNHGVTANIVFPADSVRTYIVPESDLMAVEVIHAPVRKNLIPLVPIEPFKGTAGGMYLVRHPDGVERLAVANIRYGGSLDITEGTCADVYYSKPSRQTIAGECGSPLFGRVNSAVMLLGMHVAGNGPYAAAIVFTQDMLADIMRQFTFSRVCTGAPQMKVGEVEQFVGPTHFKSHTHFETGTAVVVGSDPTFRPKGDSKVGPTYIAHAMAKLGVTTDKKAPNLKSYVPFKLALQDLLKTNRTVDVKLLESCAQDYVAEVLPHLPEGWEDDVHFYPLDTAINGSDGVAYVDALNKNTSAGAPVNCSKRRFMTFDAPTGRWHLTTDMLQAVDSVNEAYSQKQRASPIFMAHLKDQAIPEKKVLAEKVRVFVGGPMAWTIAVRQRLLWFIRLAQCNRLLFELGAGTVAQSTEWGHIYDYLTSFGKDRIVAGDFAKFDKRMGSCFILYAYWIIVQFAAAAGMAQDDIDEIWCVAEDTAFAFTNFNGDLMMFMGSNPSGHPLTVIVNSLVNSLYMRYVFRQVAPVPERSSFKKHVRLYTYGDDNIMGVKRGSDWFNHTVIAKKLSEIGVEYTMADKESKSVPFISIDDASFLKRKWRYDVDVKARLAPLEEESIKSSLLIGVMNKDTVPEAHSVAVIQGALNEYFFHGKEKFNEWRRKFSQVIIDEGLSDWLVGELRTWDECCAAFERSSRSYERVRATANLGWLDTSC